MKFIDIGDLSRRSGVPPSALRYYDDIGLITSDARHGLRRQFHPDTVVRLALIALGKAAGFSLHDIAALLGKGATPDVPRAELRAKAAALDDQIRNLVALRDTLHHVADCRAPSHMACPRFRQLLKIASRRGLAISRRTPKPPQAP